MAANCTVAFHLPSSEASMWRPVAAAAATRKTIAAAVSLPPSSRPTTTGARMIRRLVPATSTLPRQAEPPAGPPSTSSLTDISQQRRARLPRLLRAGRGQGLPGGAARVIDRHLAQRRLDRRDQRGGDAQLAHAES